MNPIKCKPCLIPVEFLEAVGLLNKDVIVEIFVDKNRIIIQRSDESDFCDQFNDDCEGCPYCCPECGECLKAQIENTCEKEENNE